MIQLTNATARFIPSLQPFTDYQHIWKFLLHIDGSGAHSDLPGSAALSVIGVTFSGSFVFLGYVAYSAAALQVHWPSCRGTNMEMETFANILALLWVFSVIQHIQPWHEFEIHFDALTAAKLAIGTYETHIFPKLRNAAAVLSYMLAQHVVVRWYHVYSHTGDPLNELVDCIASACASGRISSSSTLLPPLHWMSQYSDAQIKLLYVLLPSASTAASYPPVAPSRTHVMITPYSPTSEIASSVISSYVALIFWLDPLSLTPILCLLLSDLPHIILAQQKAGKLKRCWHTNTILPSTWLLLHRKAVL